MGAGGSGRAWLWEPEEDHPLRLPDACRDHLLDPAFESELRGFFGSVTFATSSWRHLAALSERKEEEIVDLLQQALDPEGKEGFEVQGARIIVLQGAINPQITDGNDGGGSWMNWLPNMEPRVTLYLNSDGGVRSSTAINVQDYHFQPPALPSLEALGLAARLRELREEGGEEGSEASGCCSYGLRLSQSHSVTKWRPPDGPVEWCSELAFLRLQLAPRTVIVAQICLGAAAAVGSGGATTTTEVVARSMAGEELLNLRCDLSQDSAEGLVAALAERCRCSRHRLCLVSPRGSMLRGGSPEVSAPLGPWLLPAPPAPGNGGAS